MTAHLFIVHFPIALLMIGALADLAGVGLGDRALRLRAGQLIIIGGIAAFLAFVTGEGAKIAGLSSPEVDVAGIVLHEEWGAVGTWALLGIALARAMWRTRFDGVMGWVLLALGLGGAALATAITITGTLVRHLG